MKNIAAVLLLVASAGCEKDDPLFCKMNPGATGCPRPDGDVIVGEDVMPDSDPSIDAQQCFGSGAFTICLATAPSQQLVLNPGTFDTTNNSLCLAAQPTDWASTQPDSCIVVGTSIVVPSLSVVGARPLVLLASTTITINGTLDVSSRRSGTAKVGPGSPSAACGTYETEPTSTNSGAGGGAGGSFITVGGAGGDGNGTNDTAGLALPALAAAPTALLRAGCPGQKGGTGDNANNGGDPGAGGGALYLVAGTSIAFTDNAIINASGAGAGKAGDSGGGGGGGTGGMVLFNAPAITAGANVSVIANGGGGSSGGNDTGGCGCNPGGDPDPADPLTGGAGGAGGGGAGGNGFAEGAAALNGSDGAGNLGGGGGGGGAGYIQSNVQLTNITASPTPVVL